MTRASRSRQLTLCILALVQYKDRKTSTLQECPCSELRLCLNTHEGSTHRLRKMGMKKQFQRAPGFQWESFEALAYFNFLLQGNLWFLDYFDLFFAFFFAFGTEITCRYNVTVIGLTLPTTKFCPRCQTSSSCSSSSTSSAN